MPLRNPARPDSGEGSLTSLEMEFWTIDEAVAWVAWQDGERPLLLDAPENLCGAVTKQTTGSSVLC